MADRTQTTQARGGSPNLRGLKALVIGLGLLVVLGTALVIGVVVKRFMESTAPNTPIPTATHALAPTPRGASAPIFHTTLPAGAGARIGGVAPADGSIAIWVRDAAGGKIILINPHTGTIAGTVTLGH